MLNQVLDSVNFNKTTKSDIEKNLCGKQDTQDIFATPYYDLETRTALLSQKELMSYPQYFCPNIEKIRVLYDKNEVIQGVVYDPSLIKSGEIGDAKSFPIEEILKTFGNPTLVYEGEGSIFLAYPKMGVEVRTWKEIKQNSEFNFDNYPVYLPETTFADYVLIFEPMSVEKFRERYMDQYSPYTEIEWKGVGNP